jgi:RNA polymerase sigma factor (sigma-70 family)
LLTETLDVDRYRLLCTPKDTYEAEERRVVIREAVSRLPGIYHSVVELCDFEHLSVNEAANRLGLSSQAVKSRRHRARQILRPLVAKLYVSLPLTAETRARSSRHAYGHFSLRAK